MSRFVGGSIFRSSFLLALSGGLLLAIVSIAVILTTPLPFDLPVTTLDVARALKGEPHAEQGAPLILSQSREPGIDAGANDAVVRILTASIARQANVPRSSVRLSFDDGANGVGRRQFDVARQKYEAQMLHAAKLYEGDQRFSPLIFGAFRAALRLPDGEWRIASRSPSAPQWQYGGAKGILIALLLLVPVTWWFSRRLAAPIRALGETASRIGGGAYEEVKAEGPREIRQAAAAMNQMQSRIRKHINERAEMLAAIAHDLRTPLSRLSFLLADQPLSNRARVDDELAEMDRMIGTTMDFVRAETVEPAREKLDLRLLVESVVDDFADLGHVATLEAGVSIVLSADPMMLRRVLENVIGNAIAYGKRARVSLVEEDGRALIEVRDEGPGMTDEDIARAFDPFFRAETSRNRETGGAGLGLAIAKRGVEAHGGEIVLRNAPGTGMCVSIQIPATSEAGRVTR